MKKTAIIQAFGAKIVVSANFAAKTVLFEFSLAHLLQNKKLLLLNILILSYFLDKSVTSSLKLFPRANQDDWLAKCIQILNSIRRVEAINPKEL